MKAYYTYMSDRHFVEQMRQTKQAHERFTTAILQLDVFPNLDKNSPLLYPEEDEMPAKFGPKWFEHSRKEKEAKSPKSGQEEETKQIDTKVPAKRKVIEFDMLINDDGEVDDAELERFVDEDDELRDIAVNE